MATPPTTAAQVGDLFDVRRALRRWQAAGRKAVNDYLDFYSTSVDQLADVHVKSARAAQLPVLVTIAETNAAATRDVAEAYVTRVRGLLNA
jgi:hypothetical protein